MNGNKDLKILVVDDEKVVRDFLTRLLSMEASLVKTAENAQQAIEEAKRSSFDCFFLDIRMPEMNGVELLEQLKKIAPESKYIMMTGYAVEDLLEKAKKMGVFASIKKPFDINQILSLVKNIEAKPSPGAAARLGMRILVVDDDKNVLDFFNNLLKEDFYALKTLDSGKDALHAAGNEDFDLIFLDLVLKDMSGIDLYLKIKEIRPEAAILLMTGYSEKIENIEQLGIKECLTKPFEIEKILSEIERVRKSKGI